MSVREAQSDQKSVIPRSFTMFALNATTRVYLRSGATDLRLSFEGLHALVVGVLQADALLCGEIAYVAPRGYLP